MSRAPAAAVAAVTFALGSPAAACGGDSGKTECACPDPAVKVEVPPDRAPDVVSVTLSGRACANATAQCTQPAGSGCAEYSFRATDVGSCVVELKFSSDPADFEEQVSFVQVQCCAADYVQPPTASPIDVPSAGSDAGAAE
jgi:hypothetical protein